MTEPRWKQRYRAPSLTLPRWGLDAPDHLVYASNLSGTWQVHAWDRATDRHRQVTDHPTGVRSGGATPDGASVVWFEDSKGDEIGRWLTQPFAGGEVAPLLPDAEPAWSAGLALGPGGLAAVGLASREGFQVRVGRIGEGTEELYRHEQMVDVADLSRDGGLLVVHHAEHGDNLHPALRAFDTARRAPEADLWDGKGFGLYAAGFSPVAGDNRVAVLHERTGRLRPALWDPRSGERTDYDVDLPGDVEVADWWPDASALLLVHTHLGRDELYRLDLPGGTLQRLDHPTGSIGGASVRPDGAVWYRWSSGASAPEVRALGADGVVLRPPGEAPPPGVAYESWTFTNPAGDQVHGFLAAPAGTGPHPTVMLVHGGPHHHDADSFSPEVQAWVDHGWAVALVNYRGSTGYGKAWLDVLEGDPGRPEVEDVVAGREDLVARGVADPERVVIAGASWGGYVTLQAIGTMPDGWSAALAVVPVADYVAAYAEESEGLQALDRSLFGGGPDEKPELFAERSPITHADQVKVPVLLMVGENDTRCPLQQVLNYAGRLRELGKEFELDRFDAGHGALVVDERIRQAEVELGFAARHVPGVAPPEA
ncbi:MAG TPA: prolyl oligopeptidase family serine peptidase [Actinomycetes bacterium]|jgi:dienelactone hydrolase|nr:prolyl oligopeptidase family serine peptidase [Actinomycetes bacterium]